MSQLQPKKTKVRKHLEEDWLVAIATYVVPLLKKFIANVLKYKPHLKTKYLSASYARVHTHTHTYVHIKTHLH